MRAALLALLLLAAPAAPAQSEAPEWIIASASGRAVANSASSSILQKYGPENSSGGSTICAPAPAACSTSAETAAMLSCSSVEPRAS